ncbi:MAG: hypothetical protein FWH02_08335 [Oscillospiraceae bacterium]|nr:hypothetical protein [Oscillospiraceae bacterium]
MAGISRRVDGVASRGGQSSGNPSPAKIQSIQANSQKQTDDPPQKQPGDSYRGPRDKNAVLEREFNGLLKMIRDAGKEIKEKL